MSEEKRKISFFTQGCRLNQAETAAITNGFSADRYTVVPFQEPASIAVINTCTVTENGDLDTRRLIRKVIRQNPEVKIALVGCQSQILKEKLLELPNVSWVIGNAQKMNLHQIMEETFHNDTPTLSVEKLTKASFKNEIAGIDSHHKRANIKIQDGCDFYCSFCIIPFARGPARSREFNNIIEEVNQLAKADHKEIILTGINLGTYADQDKTLYDVISELEKVEGLHRIRISSIEPTTIDDQILERMGDPTSKLCQYLHIPIQSGSDDILTAMKRHYSTLDYTQYLQKVLKFVPDIGLGTDIMVGFPGETDTHFEETYTLLRESPLSYFHVFSYSERQNTRSVKLPDKVNAQTIAKRSQSLRELSHRKRQVFYQKFIGKTLPILVEQTKKGDWVGVSEHYIKVRFKSELNLKNKIVNVQLTQIDGDQMIGKLE